MTNKIALIKGGENSENKISLLTAESCKNALNYLGHNFIELDIKDNFIPKLCTEKIKVCFNALHGGLGENGSIPGLLNCLSIPYTHSGVTASAVAINKSLTKYLLSKEGILFPKSIKLKIDKNVKAINYKDKYVIKPNFEGSSIGIKIIPKNNNTPILSSYWEDTGALLSEEFIEGTELTVGVLNGKSLCVTEIVAEKNVFYDYKSKYLKGGSTHIIPAKIPKTIQDLTFDWAEKAFNFLNCRGVIRADFRYDSKNEKLYMLEINTHPGMTETSLIPEQAQYCGISFNKLIEILLENARCD